MPTMNINSVDFRYTEAKETYGLDLIFWVSDLRLRQSVFFISEFCTCMETEFSCVFIFFFFLWSNSSAWALLSQKMKGKSVMKFYLGIRGVYLGESSELQEKTTYPI